MPNYCSRYNITSLGAYLNATVGITPKAVISNITALLIATSNVQKNKY